MAETESNLNCTDLAVARFNEGFSCSQSVFSAFAPDLGLDVDAALRVSAAFGGGMGRTGGTCGAVTGAIMVLGLRHCPPDSSAAAERAQTYKAVLDFMSRFEKRNGSIVCKKLLGSDISTPEGAKAVHERGLHQSVCPKLVRDAAEILEEMAGS